MARASRGRRPAQPDPNIQARFARASVGREYIDQSRWLNVVRVLIGLDVISMQGHRGTGSDTQNWQAPCLR